MQRILGEWNCRHFAYSIIVGKSKPKYTKEQLQGFIDRNNVGYTTEDGKHMTLYECTQMQRKLETKIRYAKEEQMIMKELGDNLQRRIARSKVEAFTREYRLFSMRCGLSTKMNRTTVPGYKSW